MAKKTNPLLAKAMQGKKPPPKKSAAWWKKLAYHHPLEWADIIGVIHHYESHDDFRELYRSYQALWDGCLEEVVKRLLGSAPSRDHFANSVGAIVKEYPCPKTKS